MKKTLLFLFFCSLSVSSSVFATKFYVDASVSASGDGLTWATSKQTIAEAQVLGTQWDSIMVKTGTYYFTSSFAFAIQRKFYGSCVGTESSPTQRPMSDIDNNGIIEPWEFSNPTTLSSTYTSSTFTYAGNSGTSIDGFTFTQPTTTLTLNNRFITVGYATNVFVNNTIKNCSLTVSMTGSTYSILFKSVGVVYNCLFEKNNITVNGTNNGTLTPTISIEGGKMYNSVIRNNTVALNYSNIATSNARGLILHVAGAASPGATVYNSLIYNNEMTYIPAGTADASMSNGCAVDAYSSTTASTYDSIYNCTIANNKGTLVGVAGLKVLYATSAVGIHVVQNNVCWNNLKGGVASDVATGGTITTGSYIANNYSKGTAFSNNGSTIVGNAVTTTPNFKSVSSGVGNENSVTDGSILTANWKLTTGSDLIGKGLSIPGTGRSTDKSGYNYASTRSVGAYEFYGYNFRSLSSGNWGTSSIWQISSDNNNWNSSSITPNSEAASINIQDGHSIIVSASSTSSSLVINAGGQLTLNNGKTLNASSLTIKADTAKAGTFVDSNTSGGLTLSGNASVQQWLSSGRNWYICSPVSTATSAVVNPAGNSNKMYWYDEAHGSTLPWAQITTNDSTLRTMKGYIVNLGADGTLNFSGTLNTGEKSITVNRTTGQLKEGFHLIGNPYPSYVNWESAVKTNIGSTIWYRTKTKAGAYTFDTYNATSHEGTNTNGIAAVTGLIPPMQTVWVRVADGQTSGSVTFNNSMRSHKTGGATALKIQAVRDEVQQSIHLTVSNGMNTDETILVFHPEASNELDAYDSEKMSNNNSAIPEVFTKTANHALVINGMSQIPTDSVIPLGFNTLTSGNFTISTPSIKNIPAGTQLLLYDNNTGEQTNLMTDSYNFNSEIASNNETRFSLVFKTPGVTTSTTNAEKEHISVFVNAQNEIVIHANAGSNYSIYNVVGQIIENGVINTKRETRNTKLNNGVYVVKVNHQSTRVIVK